MNKADLIKKAQEKLAAPSATEKIAQFRQACWVEIASGIEHMYYNGQIPPQDGSFKLLWDQDVLEITICTPHVGA